MSEQHKRRRATDRPDAPTPDVRGDVRRAYARMATEAEAGTGGGCGVVPAGGMPSRLALGCGDPVSLATLQPGQAVLDLGAGAGADCFEAAARVGPTGRVIGVDMTPEMIERARAEQRATGLQNVEFRLGEIEHLPVADESVDVVISNCVINLSTDKPQVFREAFRVLKPGGALVVSDVMTDGPLPKALTERGEWAAILAGVLEEKDYLAAIAAAGFERAEIKRVYPEPQLSTADLERIGPTEDGRPRPRAVVKVAETGEIVNTVELDPGAPGFGTRSFSGHITAWKPPVPSTPT